MGTVHAAWGSQTDPMSLPGEAQADTKVPERMHGRFASCPREPKSAPNLGPFWVTADQNADNSGPPLLGRPVGPQFLASRPKQIKNGHLGRAVGVALRGPRYVWFGKLCQLCL